MATQTSEDLYARALSTAPGGNSRTTVFTPPFPPYAVAGTGFMVTDAEGHSLIDLQNNYTSLVHGHAHPAVTEALRQQLRRGTCFGLPTEQEIVLAELLSERMPTLRKVRFTNSGTEAVMMAIRAARAYTGRPGVLSFEHCYHGSYDATLPGSAPGAIRVGRGAVQVPLNDEPAFRQAIRAHGERLACVVLDLMPNRAGLVRADPGFLEVVRSETDRRGIVLVVDEVMTSRLASGGLHGALGLTPDLITLGKWIGGGLPIGAFGGRAELMDQFDPRVPGRIEHGGTFSANPLSMVAGAVAVALLTPDVIGHMNVLGDRLRQGLRACGYLVRGSGSLLKIEDPRNDRPGLWWALYNHGVLACANGLMCTSSPMTEGLIDEVISRCADALSRRETGAGRIG